MTLAPSELLTSYHNPTDFACGSKSLDHWLIRRALTNQNRGAARTYVVCDDDKVVGYYVLASVGISEESTLDNSERDILNPIPMIILTRLAVDIAYQGRGLGRALFRDAALRIVRAAEPIGIRGIIVHAISEDAKNFYLALGFNPYPGEPLMLMITLNELRASLAY